MGRLELVCLEHYLYFTVLAYGTNFAPNKQPGAEVLSELGGGGGRGCAVEIEVYGRCDQTPPTLVPVSARL